MSFYRSLPVILVPSPDEQVLKSNKKLKTPQVQCSEKPLEETVSGNSHIIVSDFPGYPNIELSDQPTPSVVVKSDFGDCTRKPPPPQKTVYFKKRQGKFK